MSDEGRWELVELCEGEEYVVGRYTDERRARSACTAVLLADGPVEPGDSLSDTDYFVRPAGEL